MNVTIRKRPLKEKGKFALYLDLYHNKKQWQENLKLYLENEKGNPNVKQVNKETMYIAEKVRVERLHQLQNNAFGFKTNSEKFLTFNEFFKSLWKDRENSGINFDSWDSVYKHLESFNSKIFFGNIDERFLENFKNYLLTKVSQNSASQYFNIFKHAIHEAFRKKIIPDDPATKVKSIKILDTHREFLTIDEVRKLVKAECRNDNLKRAFLFSCYTGLRWSDVSKLTWKEIQEVEGVIYISFTQKKTKNSEFLPISNEAYLFLGDKSEDENEKIFGSLRYSAYLNVSLSRWMLEAGITKKISFHNARHTYAVLLLNNGVDIYTVSKLLGHKELKTTSIYAKVMNQTKIDAVNKLPQFSI